MGEYQEKEKAEEKKDNGKVTKGMKTVQSEKHIMKSVKQSVTSNTSATMTSKTKTSYMTSDNTKGSETTKGDSKMKRVS